MHQVQTNPEFSHFIMDIDVDQCHFCRLISCVPHPHVQLVIIWDPKMMSELHHFTWRCVLTNWMWYPCCELEENKSSIVLWYQKTSSSHKLTKHIIMYHTINTILFIYLCKLTWTMVAIYNPRTIYRKDCLQNGPRVRIMLNVGA